MNLIRKKWPVRKSIFFVFCCGYLLCALLAYIPGHKIFLQLLFSETALTDNRIRFLIVIPLCGLAVAGFCFFFTVARFFSKRKAFCVRSRIFLVLTTISLMTALPFILLLRSVTLPLIDAWSDQTVITAVQTSTKIADEYYHYRQLSAKTAVNTYVTMLNMSRDTKSLSWIWPKIRELDPNAASLQIFSMDNLQKPDAEIPFLSIYSEVGDSTCFVHAEEAAQLADGIYPETADDFVINDSSTDLILYVKTLRTGIHARKCIYTSRMYTGFDTALSQLSAANMHTAKITEISSGIRSNLVLIALLLVLPSLLLLPGIVYILSSRLAAPMEIMAESVHRRNSGSRSLHVLTDEKMAEEKVVGEFINGNGNKFA